ncbi:MAG TPA: hypothetical protein VNH17_03835 [Streptosporangiaceae bacterium]|nr:hypothetical protein [Streptosporangiaceae bacterium]
MRAAFPASAARRTGERRSLAGKQRRGRPRAGRLRRRPAAPRERIPYDSNALQDMINALGPDDPGFRPSCAAVGPIFGNV